MQEKLYSSDLASMADRSRTFKRNMDSALRGRGRKGGPCHEHLGGNRVGPGCFRPTASPVSALASELLQCHRDPGVDGGDNIAEEGLVAIHSHAVPIINHFASAFQTQAQLLSLWKWNDVTQSCPTLCNRMDCSLPGSSVYGIFQARILEWVAISFSRGSSRPRDRTWISLIAGRRFTIWATREAPKAVY